jgi:hypothetical protein
VERSATGKLAASQPGPALKISIVNPNTTAAMTDGIGRKGSTVAEKRSVVISSISSLQCSSVRDPCAIDDPLRIDARGRRPILPVGFASLSFMVCLLY